MHCHPVHACESHNVRRRSRIKLTPDKVDCIPALDRIRRLSTLVPELEGESVEGFSSGISNEKHTQRRILSGLEAHMLYQPGRLGMWGKNVIEVQCDFLMQLNKL